MLAWVSFVVLLLAVQVSAQQRPNVGHLEYNGNWVSTDGDVLIAVFQDSGQLWVWDENASNNISASIPTVCQIRAADNLGAGLLLSTSAILGTLDDPTCFDVMSQGNPRDSWGIAGVPAGGTRIVGQNDLLFTVDGNDPEENFDIEYNVGVSSTGGGSSGSAGSPFISTVTVDDASYAGGSPQLTVVHRCTSLAGVTQIVICYVSVTNDLAVDIDDIRYRKSTDYDPRGGVINTITVLSNQPLGHSIGLEDSPYSYENSNPGPSNPLDPRRCLFPDGCGPEQLGVTFELPIGTLHAGQTYNFQLYYGGANSKADLESTTIGLYAIPANIAFYGESFSRAFVQSNSTLVPDLTNRINSNDAAPCFDADSWLLGVGYPYTDCGCWSLWECPAGAPGPVAPVLCSGPTEVFGGPEVPASNTDPQSNTFLVHSTTSSQAYRALGCTLIGSIGANCDPVSDATTTIRSDYFRRWFCRTFDRQCVTNSTSPTSTITYRVDIAPAAGIDCTRCLSDDDCSVTEGPVTPPATRDCFSYWTCPTNAGPSFPSLCSASPESVIGPNQDENGTFGFIVHSTAANQYYSVPAGCVQQYLFGSLCTADLASPPIRTDFSPTYTCSATSAADFICTTPDFNPTAGTTFHVDIGPVDPSIITCAHCLDTTTCSLTSAPVPAAPCSDYILP